MTEEEAIKGSIKGDIKSQRFLFDTYKTKWYAVCLRYLGNKKDAEDTLQNALVKIYSNLKEFTSIGGGFGAWSQKITVNECLMQIRKSKKSKFDEIETVKNIVDTSPSQFDRLHVSDILNLLHKLPEGYRTVFNLYVMDEYSHKEIGEMLGISEGTSKSQLYKAKQILKELLVPIFN